MLSVDCLMEQNLSGELYSWFYLHHWTHQTDISVHGTSDFRFIEHSIPHIECSIIPFLHGKYDQFSFPFDSKSAVEFIFGKQNKMVVTVVLR